MCLSPKVRLFQEAFDLCQIVCPYLSIEFHSMFNSDIIEKIRIYA